METIRISVRNLVEFILRSGDIDNRRSAMADKEAMAKGSRLHRKIQGQMGASYRAEVSLKTDVDFDDFTVSVEGRADGIFEEQGRTVIDEIKGVYRAIEKMKEAAPVHLAQAKCYAYIYALQQELEEIGVQMTYANLETEEVRRFRLTFTFAELKAWFADLMEQYRKWAQFEIGWKQTRQASIPRVQFPYPYREGQKELAGAVYRTIERKKKLFIQAPTGVGKTIATVFPAVKAVGEGHGDKIFYLTAKTITRTVAQRAFALLKEHGLRYKVVTLTAKEKICMCGEPDCNPQKCPYARGHYDRINDAVFELLTGWDTAADQEIEVSDIKDSYTRDDIVAHAEKWQVCPFEMALDLSLWMDAVICDYNYAFDPRAKLKRFFADGVKGDYIFLIDEAHNLVERGREMYSAALYKEDFLEMKRLLAGISKKASRACERCNKHLLELKRECEDYEILSDIGAFSLALLNLSGQLEALLEDQDGPLADAQADIEKRVLPENGAAGQADNLRKKVLDFYFQVTAFLSIYEEMDEGYEIYAQHESDGRFKLKLYCIHTAGKLGDCLEKGRSAVFFSATLLPVRYYMELLSGTEDDYAVYAQSPFLREKKCVLVGTDVSSRYTRRGEVEYRRIAAYIQKAVQARQGNYLAFFPSYKMMEEVQSVFSETAGEDIGIIVQNPHMTELQREEFLENFRREKTTREPQSLVGFCVMGGIFGEGIDLKHDSLIGAVIVGTGIPQICEEREILKQYYDRRETDGFAHAYRYPGMNKVLQSAGRVIRTDEDRGVILLLDERFRQWEYRSNFPREWESAQTCHLGNVSEKLQKFWERFE